MEGTLGAVAIAKYSNIQPGTLSEPESPGSVHDVRGTSVLHRPKRSVDERTQCQRHESRFKTNGELSVVRAI